MAKTNDKSTDLAGPGISTYLLRTAHLGEVTVSVWPDRLNEICEAKNIFCLR